MEKEIKERLLNQELKVQREIYMSKLYNDYGKLLYKKLELWFIRKKLCIIKKKHKKKHKRRVKNAKIRKR